MSTTDVINHEELIDSRIDIHDSNQFEAKLDYTIQPHKRNNRYRIEAYFFIPKSLGINSYTYSREQFYSDIQAYIRFKTPSVSLAALTDASNAQSPLYRIEEALSAALRNHRDREALDDLSYELRLLGCLVRANIRDRVASLSASIRSVRDHVGNRPTVVADIRASVQLLLGDLEAVMEKLRGLRTRFADPVLPAWVSEVFHYVDEYLSLMLETHLTLLVEDIDRAPPLREVVSDVRKSACDMLVAERNYREGAGYTSVLSPEGEHDHYVYRRGLLKKFVMSVLFLEISKEQEGRRAGEVAAGIAAGVAMLVATGLGIMSQARYGVNSLPFVVAIVASYILKDRIKEWLKRFFTKRLTRLADYDVKIRDPDTGTVLGRCREAFSFIGPRRVPRDVWQRRHRDAVSAIEADSKPEVLMKYEKEVYLNGHTIAELYGRLNDINDIIRFNISDFLVRTDDPVRKVRHYDSEADVVDTVKCAKVYHLNVVFVLRAEDEAGAQATLERVRVIIDKTGIRRLEQA